WLGLGDHYGKEVDGEEKKTGRRRSLRPARSGKRRRRQREGRPRRSRRERPPRSAARRQSPRQCPPPNPRRRRRGARPVILAAAILPDLTALAVTATSDRTGRVGIHPSVRTNWRAQS